jgi:hypothetical protein
MIRPVFTNAAWCSSSAFLGEEKENTCGPTSPEMRGRRQAMTLKMLYTVAHHNFECWQFFLQIISKGR